MLWQTEKEIYKQKPMTKGKRNLIQGLLQEYDIHSAEDIQKDISSIDDKIIYMYVNEMTTRQLSETIEDIYGLEISEGIVSDIMDKFLPRIEKWQNRPLSAVYPIIFIDAVHFSVRDDGVIRKLGARI